LAYNPFLCFSIDLGVLSSILFSPGLADLEFGGDLPLVYPPLLLKILGVAA